MARPLVLLNFRKAGKYAAHVLIAALEKSGLLAEVEIALIGKAKDLHARLEAEQKRPILCAWTFFSAGFPSVVEELQGLGKKPGVTHIAGGVHATAEPAETLHAGFARVFRGDGEAAFSSFVKGWLHGELAKDIPGIAFLNEAGGTITVGPPQQVALDDWPSISVEDRRFNPLEITRGCVYACAFCQIPYMYKAKFRHRSITDTVRQIALMHARNMKDFRFITPTALSYGSPDENANLEAVKELLGQARETVKKRGRIFFGSFPAELRPEHVTPEAMALLTRYCDNDNMVVGAQSGSDRLLDELKRGHTVADVVTAADLIVKAGFKAFVDVIFGLPGERPEDVQMTLDLAQTLIDLGATVHGHAFMPLPGTPWKNAPPAVIAPDVRIRLSRLAKSGALFGRWQRQQETSRTLADMAEVRRI